jgi:hypothetical protein
LSSGDHESMYRVQVYVPGRQDCLVHDPVFWSAYLSVASLTSPPPSCSKETE